METAPEKYDGCKTWRRKCFARDLKSAGQYVAQVLMIWSNWVIVT
jgi:hypothetical protein